MTLTDVSGGGVFTFPTTGIWRIDSYLAFVITSASYNSRYIFNTIKVSTNGYNGTFSARSDSRASITFINSNNTYANASASLILDVTTAGTNASSGFAVRFDVLPESSNVILENGGTYNLTAFYFTRLGDT